MSNRTRFLIQPGSHVRLKDFDPDDDGKLQKAKAVQQTHKLQKRMDDLQHALYAENNRSLLICLQALDAGGKDGVIRHVVGSMSPQGCRVVSFKEPTPEELAHDFLWRVEKQTPKRGEIGIFNRSHYEDVLVVRVHDLVSKQVWKKRYAEINDFEKRLADNGTHILKFFLYISKDEQLKRFKRRLDDPSRQWKISDADYNDRKYWDEYMAAYEDALSKCSTDYAPWFVIPANHKWFRNHVITDILVNELSTMSIHIPKPTVDLHKIRREYHELKDKQ
jgi:PPK2 family polyphosphate:nucleotide phosphotransferase